MRRSGVVMPLAGGRQVVCRAASHRAISRNGPATPGAATRTSFAACPSQQAWKASVTAPSGSASPAASRAASRLAAGASVPPPPPKQATNAPRRSA
jgi:hypothetical protein